MKLLVLFLVVMMVSSSCMAGTRRAMIGGIYGQEQRHRAGKGKAVEGRRNTVEDTDKNIDNHHNIPRQEYGNWGSNSPDNGGNGDDGSG
ncbi:hypothetical protein QQP08_016199 [Theobroma cacao]|nr:hypothetical protein QQP08_016199 [Theobroma cacao]